jgi:hypothetical protein
LKPDQPSDAGLPAVAFLIIVAIIVMERARLAAEDARLEAMPVADDPGGDFAPPPPLAGD